MDTEYFPATESDPAAIFACAISIWREIHEYADQNPEFTISGCFNGADQLMREAMAIGSRFEQWACHNVNFCEFNEVWCYMLESNFGEACLAKISPENLPNFDDDDCSRVALHLRLPVVRRMPFRRIFGVPPKNVAEF